MKPDNENAYLKPEIFTTAAEKNLTEHRSDSKIISSELVMNCKSHSKYFSKSFCTIEDNK